MIHSMSGGVVKEAEFFDGAKVRLEESGEIFWFINPFPNLKEGDSVIVPVGRTEAEKVAVVLKIQKHISTQVSPVPYKRMKKILSILG